MAEPPAPHPSQVSHWPLWFHCQPPRPRELPLWPPAWATLTQPMPSEFSGVGCGGWPLSLGGRGDHTLCSGAHAQLRTGLRARLPCTQSVRMAWRPAEVKSKPRRLPEQVLHKEAGSQLWLPSLSFITPNRLRMHISGLLFWNSKIKVLGI